MHLADPRAGSRRLGAASALVSQCSPRHSASSVEPDRPVPPSVDADPPSGYKSVLTPCRRTCSISSPSVTYQDVLADRLRSKISILSRLVPGLDFIRLNQLALSHLVDAR